MTQKTTENGFLTEAEQRALLNEIKSSIKPPIKPPTLTKKEAIRYYGKYIVEDLIRCGVTEEFDRKDLNEFAENIVNWKLYRSEEVA